MGVHMKVGIRKLLHDRWHSLIDIRVEKDYLKIRGLLDEANIDYRIWMDENDEDLIFFRERFGNSDSFRVYYKFYVKRKDYKKANKVLHIGRYGVGGPMGINAIFF